MYKPMKKLCLLLLALTLLLGSTVMISCQKGDKNSGADNPLSTSQETSDKKQSDSEEQSESESKESSSSNTDYYGPNV